ncbi:ribosome biogenesis protein [Saccharomycopsis crataegensis]|uniref:Ribosome biogenesis protein n=1 Tax=Saccharomycopsis crataegensis TaxID=43959 RepID=A0AAV5QKU2_9ASCO|nr:ribosome biogenesis protein [Saccharomycopsis crataegensis]
MSSIYKALSKSSGANSNKDDRKKHINRQKVLIISSRGVTYRHRHLINDLHALMPHSKKQAKIGSKKNLFELNEVAELYNCNNIAYFETKKHQDLYLWLTKSPNGPSLKFFVQNMSTLDELNFTGNCLKGSRPVLSFDKSFDENIAMQLTKEILIHTFGVPPTSRKIKPFIDHVMTFSIVDGKIWIRNYQINEQVVGSDLKNDDLDEKLSNDEIQLVEIGPRAVLTPIVILEGAFCGPKIFENKQFVSPNVVRAQLKNQQAEQAKSRQDSALQNKIKKRENVLKVDPLSNEALFKKK